jgi:hypothetical protein
VLKFKGVGEELPAWVSAKPASHIEPCSCNGGLCIKSLHHQFALDNPQAKTPRVCELMGVGPWRAIRTALVGEDFVRSKPCSGSSFHAKQRHTYMCGSPLIERLISMKEGRVLFISMFCRTWGLLS